MSAAILPYIPSLAGLLALGALLVIAASFVGLGSRVGQAPMPVEILFVSGWSLTILAAILFGTATAATLSWILYPLVGFGLLAAGMSIRARLAAPAADAGRLILIGLPVLCIVSAASASQWDEFAHWLVNQRYLVEVGTFPRRGLPENTTIFSAYPYGLALTGYLISGLAGGFAENAGALTNTLLILVLGSVAIRAFRAGANIADRPLSWTAAAGALLAATLLNPTFVPKLTFTTYADWTTAVVLGVATWLAWHVIEKAVSGAWQAGFDAALHLGLALALLLALKQPNVLLAGLLIGGMILTLLLTTFLPLGVWLQLGLRILLPPAVGYLAWRYHVAHHMPGREFGFSSLADWLWQDLGAILARMLLIASKKGGYFGLMVLASGTAGYMVARRLSGGSVPPVGRLAILVGSLFLGYNLFLYVAYVGAFGAGEGHNAASYWRYNTQLGGAALVFGAVAAGILWLRLSPYVPFDRRARATIVVLAVAVSFAFAPKLRFDLNPVTRYVRAVGVEIAGLVPSGSRLIVVDPADNGKRALLMRYETKRREVERLLGIDVNDPAALKRAFAAMPDSYVWVHVPTPALSEALAVSLSPLSSHLVATADGGSRLVRSWPYPGYTDPVGEDD